MVKYSIIKHQKLPNLAILKLGIMGFRGIGLLSSKIVPVTPKIKNFQNLGVLGIMGGHFFNIALFHSKRGRGDQNIRVYCINSFKSIFMFKFEPNPKFNPQYLFF